MCLEVQTIEQVGELNSLRPAWDRMDGDVPFRSFDWLATWWRHYGQPAGFDRKHLHVLVVRKLNRQGADAVVGIAPWYAERTRTRGTVLRWLGGGEVCSDHLSVLCELDQSNTVTSALAAHLAKSNAWDRLELDSVDESDAVLQQLAQSLRQHDCSVETRADGNCWIIDLPDSWEAFLQLQSKSHRKQLRRAGDRMLDSGAAVWHRVETDQQLGIAWPLLMDLHQRRRISLGEPGCFASSQFAAFHAEMAPKLLAAGQLRLGWLELEGQPISAEYQLAGPNRTYAYQGGVDPDRMSDEPGRLSNIATLREAIAAGHLTFDFLRGDEPYKAHWRAQPQATYSLRALAPSHAQPWLAQTADWADSVASAVKARLRPLITPLPQNH